MLVSESEAVIWRSSGQPASIACHLASDTRCSETNSQRSTEGKNEWDVAIAQQTPENTDTSLDWFDSWIYEMNDLMMTALFFLRTVPEMLPRKSADFSEFIFNADLKQSFVSWEYQLRLCESPCRKQTFLFHIISSLAEGAENERSSLGLEGPFTGTQNIGGADGAGGGMGGGGEYIP